VMVMHPSLIAAIDNPAAALAAVAYTRQAGVMQVFTVALNFNQAAASYDIATGTTQAVAIESVVIRMPNSAAAAALVSVSAQTNDATTAQVFIPATDGVFGNCTANAQLGSALAAPIILAAGAKIQYTLAGNNGAAYAPVAYVFYRAIVSGGYLA
jgi:hypothetical protein